MSFVLKRLNEAVLALESQDPVSKMRALVSVENARVVYENESNNVKKLIAAAEAMLVAIQGPMTCINEARNKLRDAIDVTRSDP